MLCLRIFFNDNEILEADTTSTYALYIQYVAHSNTSILDFVPVTHDIQSEHRHYYLICESDGRSRSFLTDSF